MWDFIEKLRNYPEKERKSIAIFGAILLTLVILIPWFVFYRNSTGDDENHSKSVAEVITPFSLLGQEATDVTQKIQYGLGEVSSVTHLFTLASGGGPTATSATTTIK